MTTVIGRARSQRIEVRTTAEDRALIDRAVRAADTDLTEFVTTHLRVAAMRVLADRHDFALDAEGQRAWERINRRPARTLAGVSRLMSRPSPFDE